MKVEPYRFYANTTAPKVPAYLGLQSISGLSDIDRFYTQAQLDSGSLKPTPGGAGCEERRGRRDDQPALHRRAGRRLLPVRSASGLYNITGHGFDGTGQTIGFTLWTAAERQAAMTRFAPRPATR